MSHNKIHLIIVGCPLPSIYLQCRILAQNIIHLIALDNTNQRIIKLAEVSILCGFRETGRLQAAVHAR